MMTAKTPNNIAGCACIKGKRAINPEVHMATAVATPTGNAASKRLEGALRYSKVSLDMTKNLL
tara:strand:+ start:71 stop:259 length:189 start_codon:yes stop_codon:yes gene_type:complete